MTFPTEWKKNMLQTTNQFTSYPCLVKPSEEQCQIDTFKADVPRTDAVTAALTGDTSTFWMGLIMV